MQDYYDAVDEQIEEFLNFARNPEEVNDFIRGKHTSGGWFALSLEERFPLLRFYVPSVEDKIKVITVDSVERQKIRRMGVEYFKKNINTLKALCYPDPNIELRVGNLLIKHPEYENVLSPESLIKYSNDYLIGIDEEKKILLRILPKSYSYLTTSFAKSAYYNEFNFLKSSPKLAEIIDNLLYKASKYTYLPRTTFEELLKMAKIDNGHTLLESIKKYKSEDDFVIDLAFPTLKMIPESQIELLKNIHSKVLWNKDLTSPLTRLAQCLTRIQDADQFIKIMNEKMNDQGNIISQLRSSITYIIGYEFPVPYEGNEKLFEFNTKLKDLQLINNLSFVNNYNEINELGELYKKAIKSYENKDCIEDLKYKQRLYFSLTENKHQELVNIISKNFSKIDDLTNKVERYTRAKKGTKEFEDSIELALMSDQFLGINPKHYKDFIQLIENYDYSDAGNYTNLLQDTGYVDTIYNEEIDCIAKILAWFKDDWRKALTIFSQKEKNWHLYNCIHNLGNVLPDKVRKISNGEKRISPPDMRNYFLQWSKRSDFDSLLNVLKLWNDVTKEDIVNNIPPKELYIKILQNSNQFEGVKHPEFFSETAGHEGTMDSEKYLERERIFLKSQKIPLPKWTENILVEEIGPKNKKYIGRFLPRSDVRGLYLGEYTNCCQHPGGDGEPCAYHGQCSLYGAFFVVENEEGDIIAQSWVWEAKPKNNELAVVFDNIETRGAQGREEVIIHLYEKAAELMKASEVRIGESFTKVDLQHLPEDPGSPYNPSNFDQFDSEQIQFGDEDLWRTSRRRPKDGLYIPRGDYSDYYDAQFKQRVLKHQNQVNKLPENPVFSYQAIDDDEDEAEENKTPPTWWLENPYSNLKKAMKMLQFAHFAESKGLIRLADKFTIVALIPCLKNMG